MEVIIEKDAQTASTTAARMIARLVREKPKAVLGLATGGSPVTLYQELARMHRENGLDFRRVTSFNLDEYVGLAADHPASYRRFMQENLFGHINIHPADVHIPDGLADDIPAACRAYEAAIAQAGGIDLQVLGIGSDGHIGFNEPSSSLASRTRIKTLTPQTRQDNARFFDDDPERVPLHVLTMGIGTIMEARAIIMLVFGAHKAEAAAGMIEGPVCAMNPGSMLQHHPTVKVLLDPPAAEALKLRGYYEWVYRQKPEWQRDAL